MTTIFNIKEWQEIANKGTSGDQVWDILASWKADRDTLLRRIEEMGKAYYSLEQQLEDAEEDKMDRRYDND